MISTTIIEEESLEHLSDISYCPMIFQPYIDKEYELRIVYVDGEFLQEKINNSENADWRVAREGYFWEEYELPDTIKANLTSMMKEMGLYIGAIDMIKGRDGAYYFLEVNPQGEWECFRKSWDFPSQKELPTTLSKELISMNKILIITHTADNFSIEKVTEYIEKKKNNCEVIPLMWTFIHYKTNCPLFSGWRMGKLSGNA